LDTRGGFENTEGQNLFHDAHGLSAAFNAIVGLPVKRQPLLVEFTKTGLIAEERPVAHEYTPLQQVMLQVLRACPALLLLLPVTVIVYAVWRRTRYFGNTAPLLVAVLFFALGMAHPDPAGAGFILAAIPFLFIFVAGVLADLMETRYGQLVTACVVALLATSIVKTLADLARVPRG
jgi:hypothetical protein